jgi:hypothetical protein
MALNQLRLALLTFARGWDGATLSGSVLLLPSGDPTAPLFGGTSARFAGTKFALQAVVAAGTDTLATTTLTGVAVTPPDLSQAETLFGALGSKFAVVDQTAPGALPPTTARVMKPLPPSYTGLLPPGATRSAFAATPDDFLCAQRGRQPTLPLPPPPPRTVSWGQVISYALRNPALARALGLIWDFTVPAAALPDSGWLFVSPLAADGGSGLTAAWNATPDAVKCYASFVPPMVAARPLFSAVLFPVSNPASPTFTPDQSALDRAFQEAEAYSEGFARLVHVRQPDSIDTATGAEDAGVAPGSDAGIQIGWDDEQVAEWHNRQIALSLGAGPIPSLESPVGVLGYRVDVRIPSTGEPAGSNAGWSSLMAAAATVPPAYVGKLTAFSGELTVEPTPSALAGAAQFWLPLYFSQWRGTQLGVRDDLPRLLAGGVAAGKSTAPVKSAFAAIDVPGAPRLIYGTTYQFRVRLADLTGAGPGPSQHPTPESAAQRTTLTFSRHVPPKAFTLATTTAPAAEVSGIALTRPRLGYPDALLTPRYGATGLLARSAAQALLAQLGYAPDGTPPTTPPSKNPQLAIGLPDPDVKTVELRVEVRTLAGDTADDVSADGRFLTVYRTTRAVPPLPNLPAGRMLTPAEVTVDTPLLTIDIAWEDYPEITTLASQGPAEPVRLLLPRTRDVRVVITPIGDGKPGYFGSFVNPARTPPTIGMTAKLNVRAPATAEPDLFAAPLDGSPALQAFFFRPVDQGDIVSGIMQRLAEQLHLLADGLTLYAAPGERVVFGCSGGFKHQIAPDGSRITFASAAELLAKWSLVFQAVIQRDWTWDGLVNGTLQALTQDVAHAVVVLGNVQIPRSASTEALSGTPDRTRTRVVFVHAIDPTVPDAADGLAARPPIWLQGMIAGSGGDVAVASAQVAMRLPLAIPPADLPEPVSAGYALSPYVPGAAYASTGPRDRRLWVEFTAAPPKGFAIFARVLAYAPDPLLYTDRRLLEAPPPTDPALPLDPETLRLISPGQPIDEDGAETMVPLIPSSDRPNRFVLPLPPGLDPQAPELMGMWTYEFRVGRVTKAMVAAGTGGTALWCLAHARFGRPLRLAGLQHPAPALSVVAQWRPRIPVGRIDPPLPPVLVATAGYTRPVLHGQLVGNGQPYTTIAFLLYAQVPQADGSVFRNVLLKYVLATPVTVGNLGPALYAQQVFRQADILAVLDALGLPASVPLSVVGVEFLPAGGSVEGGRQHPDGQPDPLGGESFARRRILRTSPLTPVEPACCVLPGASALAALAISGLRHAN